MQYMQSDFSSSEAVHNQRTTYTNGRIQVWDVLKFILIFLVIWGHCIDKLLSSNCYDSTIFRIIYSFHMPLFMMISGYFSLSSMNLKFLGFLKKKFWQLIYPCIIWGSILWVVLEINNSFHYGHKEISLLGLLQDFYWLADFWFLKSLFICYVIAYTGSHLIHKRYWIPTTLFISQLISPFFVSFMYPSFVIGMELRQNKFLLNKLKHNNYIIFSLFVVMLLFWNREMWINSHGIPSGFYHFDLQTWIDVLSSRCFRLLIGIVGSLAILAFFHALFNKQRHGRYIDICLDWGRYTLKIYILQAVILEKWLGGFIRLDNLPNTLCNIFIPLFAFILLSFFVYISKLIQHSLGFEKLLWGSNN